MARLAPFSLQDTIALSTPVLVLFAPCGVHHGAACLWTGERNPASARTQAAVRLRDDGVFDHGNCDLGPGGLGPSHVRICN